MGYLKGDLQMKIVVPSADGKLCGHFGHCESFSALIMKFAFSCFILFPV